MIEEVNANVLLVPIEDGIRISVNGMSFDKIMQPDSMVWFAIRLLEHSQRQRADVKVLMPVNCNLGDV